jgi:predicted phosphodiesterase
MAFFQNFDQKGIKEFWISKAPYYRQSEQSWSQHSPALDNPLRYTVLLIGDMGKPDLEGNDPVLNLIRMYVEARDEQIAIVFLGDNIYPRGLPALNHRLREISERRLLAQLEVLAGLEGKAFFLSGNHDWNKSRSNGYEYLLRQEQFIREYTGNNILLPENGCPGPEVVELTKDVVLVIINTQWWIQRGFRPIGALNKCQVESEAQFFSLLEGILDRNKHKNIIITGHHPLYSNSLNDLYLSLPFASSLYPLYRQFPGVDKDMIQPRYRRMRKRLLAILKKHENLIYAGGHDHNLQYFSNHQNHFLVSGSGSKTTYVRKGGKASYTHAHRGFFQINYHQNGEVWMQAIGPDEITGEPMIMYRKKIVE